MENSAQVIFFPILRFERGDRMRIILDEVGQYLRSDDKNFIIFKDNRLVMKAPFNRVKRIVFTPGSMISTSALFWCSVYKVDLMMVSKTGKPTKTTLPLTLNAQFKDQPRNECCLTSRASK
jgi:CRISPR/Cas system-associated endonuclease Cas1